MSKKKKHFHRNKGPKKIRTRVYREMYRDPELLQSDKNGLLRDEYWNPYDPYEPFTKSNEWSLEYRLAQEYDQFFTVEEGDYNSEHDYHLLKRMEDIYWGVLNMPLQNKELTNQVNTDKLILDFENNKAEQKISLDKLQAFLNNTHSPVYRRTYLTEYIKKSSGHPISIVTLENISNKTDHSYNWKLLLLFSPFWIRSPLSWSKESGISIVEHLFVRYQTPEYLYKIWIKTNRIDFKWLSWFLLIAQGGSMKKAARNFGWRFSSKTLQYLLEADKTLSPIEAYIYAEIKRMNGSDRMINLILDCPPFVVDLTNPTTDDDFIRFWRNSVQWVIQHENEITDRQINHVLDWAMHEFTESGMRGNRCFSWRGRSLERVLERSTEYRQMIWRPNQVMHHTAEYRPARWQEIDVDWETEGEIGDVWSFTELNSSKELHEEGRVLKHCVGGYSNRCVVGNSAIVSLKKNGKRLITIELNPVDKSIIQARGKRNRNPDETEMKIIRKWLDKIVRA